MELYLESETESGIYAADRILSIALDIAEKMLEKGAQVQRVEDTIVKICLAYGADQVEPFAITSLVQATVRMPNGYHTTQLRRVYETNTDLTVLEKLVHLTDRVCKEKPSLDEVERTFQEIVAHRRNTLWMDFVGMPLGAGTLAGFFGGNLRDVLATAIIGLIVACLNLFLTRRVINPVARTAINSFLSGLLAVLLCKVGLGEHVELVMMGTIMLFITGILFGNALRDLLCGDLIAGMLKCLQAFIMAFAIAAGYSLAIFLGGLL